MLLLTVTASANHFATAQAPAAQTVKKANAAEQGATREIYGKIQSIKGTMVTLQTRTGTLVQVDLPQARLWTASEGEAAERRLSAFVDLPVSST